MGCIAMKYAVTNYPYYINCANFEHKLCSSHTSKSSWNLRLFPQVISLVQDWWLKLNVMYAGIDFWKELTVLARLTSA